MSDNIDKIYNYWTNISEEESKHSDAFLNEIEISNLMNYLEEGQNILDIGCGAGRFDIFAARNLNVDITGVDYSENMLIIANRELSKESLKGRVRFMKGNATDLNNFDDEIFDIVISKRCLISLPGWDMKERALDEIHRVLRKKGIFLFMEATKDGLIALNELRRYFGLKEIETRWHNDYFNLKDILDYCDGKFKMRKTKNFSLYYIITRIINPALSYPQEPNPEDKINEIAKRLQKLLPDRYFQSPHLFLVMEKA